MTTKTEKRAVIKPWQYDKNDTGSTEVQIALLTNRINYLTEHLKVHKKDFLSKHGLMKLVGRRRRLLNYVKRKDFPKYNALVDKLNLRG